MSQWGAHGLALQGADFRQILLHYYRGAEIRPYRPSDDPAVALRLRSESAWWG
jgi:stage II sporulation protein D